MSKRRQRGLTFIETGATLLVLAVLASLAAPSFLDQLQRRRVEGVATELLGDLQFLRGEAVARNETLRISFGASADGASCWVLHSGAAGSCDCTGICSGGAREVKTVRLTADGSATLAVNVASIIYEPRHGTSTPTATLRVTGRDGRAIHQVVNIMGRVRSCSPNGAFPGYRAC